MNNETVPTKFCADASFNHLIKVRNNSDALLTIHNDGTITAAEHLKPTETAAAVLQIMRENWMNDIQCKKIKEQEDRIKKLEEAGDAMVPSCFDRLAKLNWQQAKEAKP